MTKHRPEVTFHDPNNDPKLKQNPDRYVFKKSDTTAEEQLNTKVCFLDGFPFSKYYKKCISLQLQQMKELLSMLSFKANRAQKSKDNMPEAEKQERYENLKRELTEYQKQQHPHKKRVPTFGSHEEDLIRFDENIDNEKR